MSLKNSLKNTSLSLGGVDIPKRDGKAIDALKPTVKNTPLSLKGETPKPDYSTIITDLDPGRTV
tara:strand:- start:168 stop:359 length:192 start_codon:yes stop_codon:yes gene_type:complete